MGVAGAAAWRVVSRRRKAPVESPDPRADELRKRLDESRALVSEREEFEQAETPVDHVGKPEEPGVEDRRKSVHEHARAKIDELRSDEPGSR
jgi:DNA segregation ATPase FtsK/SpoIIIE-like protein